jgi:predicted nucleic acid-binding Zn ribbon protein
MPIYDLICECGYSEKDIQMTVADYEKATCPKCNGRLKSNAFPKSFQLLGDGWTPELTGSFRYRERPEIEYEVNDAYKTKVISDTLQRERERKIYIT